MFKTGGDFLSKFKKQDQNKLKRSTWSPKLSKRGLLNCIIKTKGQVRNRNMRVLNPKMINKLKRSPRIKTRGVLKMEKSPVYLKTPIGEKSASQLVRFKKIS
jgi:hypothetical protein